MIYDCHECFMFKNILVDITKNMRHEKIRKMCWLRLVGLCINNYLAWGFIAEV